MTESLEQIAAQIRSRLAELEKEAERYGGEPFAPLPLGFHIALEKERLRDTEKRLLASQTEQLTDLADEISESEVPEEAKQKVQRIRDLARTVREVANALSVPIRFPLEDDMAIYLVPRAMLDRLLEYQADENLWWALFGAFLGAVSGIAVNWLTADRPARTSGSIIAFLVFILVSGVFGLMVFQTRRRAKRVKEAMFRRGYRQLRFSSTGQIEYRSENDGS